MKFRPSVGVGARAPGVVFFAQCLDEILYPYTPANYKPRVMGLRALVGEAGRLVRQIEDGSVDQSRIVPVLDELRVVLRDNSVAKSLLNFPAEYYLAFHEEKNIHDLSVRLGLLENRLSGGRYEKAVQHELIRLCQDDKRKGEIRAAARDWVASIRSLGFSSRHMAKCVEAHFFTEPVKCTVAEELVSFFHHFERKNQEWVAYFCCNAVARNMVDFSSKFNCVVLDSGEEVDGLARLGMRPEQNEQVVRVEKIEARDIFSARNRAEKRLEHISDLYSIFHHKNKILWRASALVGNSIAEFESIDARASSVKRSRDNVPAKASQKLASVIGGLSFSDGDSLGKFISLVRLHGSAQAASSSQAQIINLWTAMEVLVPRASDSKLRGVLKLIMPFLTYGYFDKMLYALAGDLYRWRRNGTSRILRSTGLSEWSQHQKLAAVLRGGPFESQRNDLYALTAEFPLLMNRCFVVSEAIATRAHMRKRLKDHQQRISWQIQRIYRARNSIVHDGVAPGQVDALAENAHEYVDEFIDRFLVMCAEMKYVTSIEEAVAFQTKLASDWEALLQLDEPVTSENVRECCALSLRRKIEVT